MKTLLLSGFALLLSVAVFAQQADNKTYQFDKETFDYGQVQQHVPVKAVFVVTNESDKPLIIEDARPSCGCTVGDFTKEPIEPGKTGTITAVFNAEALGPIRKTVSVKFAGIDDIKFLRLAGTVLSPEEYAKVKGVAQAPSKGK